jgi:hypothetical protein
MGRNGSVLGSIGSFRKKTGYGPWRILADCPAEWHNTLTAARGDGRRTGSFLRCYCPRAEQLLKEYNDRRNIARRNHKSDPNYVPDPTRHASSREARRRRHPLLDIGGGPWQVLADCPAILHNTLRAARGKVTHEGHYYPERCTCPRAQSLLREYLDRQILRRRLARSGEQLEDGRRADLRRPMTGRVTMITTVAGERVGGIPKASRIAASAVILADMPDLHGGRCTTGDAQVQKVFADAIMSTDDDSYAIRTAKSICATCPFEKRDACAQWALKGEQTPGDWGGVYGGLSPRDRRNARYGARVAS